FSVCRSFWRGSSGGSFLRPPSFGAWAASSAAGDEFARRRTDDRRRRADRYDRVCALRRAAHCHGPTAVHRRRTLLRHAVSLGLARRRNLYELHLSRRLGMGLRLRCARLLHPCLWLLRIRYRIFYAPTDLA